MQDDQNQPISTEAEEKHDVEKDGEPGPQEVIAQPATRRYWGGVVIIIAVVVVECCIFHL